MSASGVSSAATAGNTEFAMASAADVADFVFNKQRSAAPSDTTLAAADSNALEQATPAPTNDTAAPTKSITCREKLAMARERERAKRFHQGRPTRAEVQAAKAKQRNPNAPRAPYAHEDAFERERMFTVPLNTIDNYEGDEERVAALERANEEKAQQRLKELEAALPPTVREVDNLSGLHRPGEIKAKPFTGSIVHYAMKVHADALAAHAAQLLATDPDQWRIWHEQMFEKHASFANAHYKIFRRILEGRLETDPEFIQMLVLARAVETKKLHRADMDQLVSEQITIDHAYPTMRQRVEAERAELAAAGSGGASSSPEAATSAATPNGSDTAIETAS